MENFIVSARKYRPSTFKSVIGQASITTTLKNAIKNNHLAQAYLFCGPRGVGKTTCARIFAKTINCKNLDENVEPCNQCESCESFNQNRSYNIHELDAASNNSVEDIRNLIEQVRIPPQVGKYSIYIIDEVHMLSSQAFNAFLKTLEEPPSHAIFILATTEKHKIIPTILSRCQIFDFNRIRVDDTVDYLEYIAKEENISYELDGLNIIAQKADGAMRDALSIFDQVVSFSGSNITYQGVIDNLNVLDYDYYFKVTEAFIQNNISQVLLTFNEILDKGFDAHHFINGLSEHFRNLLVCKDEITLQLLEVGANIRDRYNEQTKACSSEFLFSALQISNKCDIGYKLSKSKRLHVELSLIELCNITVEKKNSSQLEKQPDKEQVTRKKSKADKVEVSAEKKAVEAKKNIPAYKNKSNSFSTRLTQCS
jgi:DNA polymerase-3 subunit gamma/tau